MFTFTAMSFSCKHHKLQNLLVLKMLQDRGIAVPKVCEDVTVDWLLGLLFGEKNVKIEEAVAAIPDVYENPEPDSEEEWNLLWFKERPQYLITVRLPFACTGEEAAELESVLQGAVVTGEDAFYMLDMFFLEASVRGKEAVMRFVDYHPDTAVDGEYVDLLFLFRTLIGFWDKVREIVGRRAKK